MSSSGGSKELVEENHRLNVELQRCKESLEEKIDQVCKKNEALINCQMANVKHLSELAEAMKEKMEYHKILEEHKKTIASCHEQMAAQKQEILALQNKVDTQRGEVKQLNDCQDNLRRVTEEKEQLTSQLRQQEVELAQQRASTRGQPTTTSTLSTPSRITPNNRELYSELWSWKARCSVPKDIFQLYENQRQLFFLVVGLKKVEWIDHHRFKELWQQRLEWGVENLFAEILARKHVYLSDPYSTFMMIGDVGARILLYYSSLENQWILRSQFPINAERKHVSWQEYGVQVSSQFYGQSMESLQRWREVLQSLLTQLRQPNFLREVLSANTKRLSLSLGSGFTGSY